MKEHLAATSRLPENQTTFSMLSDRSGPFHFVERMGYGLNGVVTVFKDEEGIRWYEIPDDVESRFPKGQMFFARLLKPIIGTCDIVRWVDEKGGTHYLSREATPDTIAEDTSVPATKAHEQSLKLFFRKILRDHDKKKGKNMSIGEDEHFFTKIVDSLHGKLHTLIHFPKNSPWNRRRLSLVPSFSEEEREKMCREYARQILIQRTEAALAVVKEYKAHE